MLVMLIIILILISQFLTSTTLPALLDQLSSVTVNSSADVINSPATISTIVQILSNIGNATLSQSISITNTLMTVRELE